MIRRPPRSTLFPYRRSSDLVLGDGHRLPVHHVLDPHPLDAAGYHRLELGRARRLGEEEDRKSTRLNSSHLVISYAVFCLKKKKKYRIRRPCCISLRSLSNSL